ncbi:hypothetical protein C0Q70_12654 [Pomacea canaliculata]|uniref:Uncharacterized protein n=1 Tax=Pomacea canaliculata TaxID=400727 RepID=A0A2T7P277_POMCA|nr:hypothetical protein C0Q70_12654 [Pomacea canaliculata]
MQLEIPEGAVMVECRFNVSNLVLVNMSERGQPHNVFAGVKERRCERLLTFSHCRFTEDSVTLWAVFTNVTVAAARTVFCNQTTIADDTTVDKSFNITLGDYITPAPDIGTTTVATTGGKDQKVDAVGESIRPAIESSSKKLGKNISRLKPQPGLVRDTMRDTMNSSSEGQDRPEAVAGPGAASGRAALTSCRMF